MARRDPIYDMKFYLSGPMSGLPEYNYPTFEAAVRYLRAHQLYVESPHENEWPDKYDDADHLNSIMLEKAVHQMNRCNAIILLPGWPFSKGVRVELDLAISNKWPVFYFTMEDKPFIRSTLIRMDTLR
jgi:hypothetical protein